MEGRGDWLEAIAELTHACFKLLVLGGKVRAACDKLLCCETEILARGNGELRDTTIFADEGLRSSLTGTSRDNSGRPA